MLLLKRFRLSMDADIPISYHHRPEGPAGEYTVRRLTPILEEFGRKLHKRSPVQRLEVFFDQPKNPVGKTVAHRIMIHVHFADGASYVAEAEQYVSKAKHVGLETSVREAMREIEEQIRRKRRKAIGR